MANIMKNDLHLKTLIDSAVLNHLQTSFAEEHGISVAIFDDQGHLILEPSRCCPLDEKKYSFFVPFLEFILTWPPNLADLGLTEGNKTFSSFFNGLVLRAILPLMAPKKTLGAIQLVFVDMDREHELLKWRDTLDGFTFNYISYLAFLDNDDSTRNEKLVQLSTQILQKLENILEANLTRLQKIQTTISVDPSQGGDVITTPHHDIIHCDPSVCTMLGYDSSAELLGVNLIDTFIAQPEDRENIRHFLDIKGQLAEYPLYLSDKAGRLRPCKMMVDKEDLGEDAPTGFRYTIRVADEKEIVRPGLPLYPLSSKKPEPEEKPTTTDHSASVESTSMIIPSQESLPSFERLDDHSLKWLDAAVESLFVLDDHNRILAWNQKIAELLHCPPQSIVGGDFQSLLVGDSQRRWTQWLQQLRHDANAPELTQPLYVVDGNGDLYAITLQPQNIVLQEKSFLSFVVTSHEKSSLEQAFLPTPTASHGGETLKLIFPVQSVDKKHEQLVPFVNKLADHFEKQLTKIHRHAIQFNNEAKLDSSMLEHAQQIKRLAEQVLYNLELLHYYGQRVRPQRQEIQINELLKNAADIQQSLFSRPYRIQFDLQEDVYTLAADPLLLQQALSLLINFGCKSTPDGGTLHIRTRNTMMPTKEGETMPSPHHAVLVEISYPSFTFSEQGLERLFEPFADAQSLELSAIYGIIRSHEGKVEVAGDSANGTCFRLYLPATLPSTKEKAQKKGCVLIIDDERGIVDVNALILQHHGLKVFTANSFHQGMKLLQQHADVIDCILLDVMLPDMEVPASVEKIRELSSLPIILSSGYPPDETITAILPTCRGPFLQKPYRKNALLETIRKLIDKF